MWLESKANQELPSSSPDFLLFCRKYTGINLAKVESDIYIESSRSTGADNEFFSCLKVSIPREGLHQLSAEVRVFAWYVRAEMPGDVQAVSHG